MYDLEEKDESIMKVVKKLTQYIYTYIYVYIYVCVCVSVCVYVYQGFPGGLVVKNPPANCLFDPWVGKIPWRS